MNLFDLFEGAIDDLEARRIEDLEAKMDDLMARAKEATDPNVIAALRHQFAIAVAERNSYYKLNVDEAEGDFKNIIRKVMSQVHVDGGGGNLSYMISKKAPTMDMLRDVYHDDIERMLTKAHPNELKKAASELNAMNGQMEEDVDTNYTYTVFIDGTKEGTYGSKEEAKAVVKRKKEQAPGREYTIRPKSRTSMASIKKFQRNRDRNIDEDDLITAEGFALDSPVNQPPMDPANKWKIMVRQLIADYIKNPRGLYHIAKQKGPNSAEAFAYNQIMHPTGKIALPPGAVTFEDQKVIEAGQEASTAQIVKKILDPVAGALGSTAGGSKSIYNPLAYEDLDEEGKGTPVPAKEFARGVLKDLKKVNVKEQGVAEGNWSNVIHTTDRSDEKAQREQEHKKQAGLAATVLKNHSHALDPKEIDLLTRYNLHHRGKPGVRFDRLDNEKAQQLIQNVLRFNQQGVAEAQTDYQKRRQRERDVDAGKPVPKQREPRMTDYQKRRAEQKRQEALGEGADQAKQVVKDKAGKPIGEIGIDLEASPGNGEWYVKHYATGYDVVGFDSAKEALKELMYAHHNPEMVEDTDAFTSAGLSGIAATQGTDNPLSPIGSGLGEQDAWHSGTSDQWHGQTSESIDDIIDDRLDEMKQAGYDIL